MTTSTGGRNPSRRGGRASKAVGRPKRAARSSQEGQVRASEQKYIKEFAPILQTPTGAVNSQDESDGDGITPSHQTGEGSPLQAAIETLV